MNNKKKLKKVKDLLEMKDNGIIDEEKFELLKNNLINKPPFRLSKKSVIIISALLIVGIAATSIGFISYKNYIDRENAKRKELERIELVQKQEQQRKEQEQKKNEEEKAEFSKLANEMYSLYGEIYNSKSEFSDSAFFAKLYLINYPNYYSKWISELNELKSKTIELENFLYRIKNTKFQKSENKARIDDLIVKCEISHNDLFVIVREFNNILVDYNKWAKNYNSIGDDSVIYLDSYAASDFSIEIDFNNDGNKSNVYGIYLK